MSKTLLLIYGHLLIPTMSGILFLLVYFYFRISRQAKTAGLTYFRGFLLTMSLYLLGRSVQVLSGPFPYPMIVADLRLFILLGICFPCAYLAAANFGIKSPPRNRKLVFGIGLILSILYTTFHILGNEGDYVIGTLNEITLYGTYEPSFKAPFYGREVTVLIQGLSAVLFIGLGIYKNINRVSDSVKKKLPTKFILFYTGMSLFAITILIGCLLKVWSIFYIGSLPCAIIIAWGMFIDVRERHSENTRINMQLCEELLRNLRSMSRHPKKWENLLHTVGMEAVPTTVMVVNFIASGPNGVEKSSITEEDLHTIDQELSSYLGMGSYLMIPVGLSVTLLLPNRVKDDYISMAEDICERLATIQLHCIIGVGSSYERVQDLWRSREEAEQAHGQAVEDGESMVIHIDDLLTSREADAYPFRERTVLIDALKSGIIDDVQFALDKLLQGLTSQVAPLPSDHRVMVQEIFFLCKESVAESSGEREDLDKAYRIFCGELASVDNTVKMDQLLSEAVVKLTNTAKNTRSTKTHHAVTFAKEYVEINFKKSIKIKDLAEQIHISQSYYRSLFTKYVGVSFGQFLIDTRMRKAKEFLSDPNLTVSEVSYEVGYDDSNYFSTLFKKNVGISPTAYRKKVLDPSQ